MSSIFQTYVNAILADATYALGKPAQGDLTGATGSRLTSYLSERMTPTIAKYIGDNFTVVSHIETGDGMGSGFDATVWKDTAGKLYVSMQGTLGLGDVLSDINLATNGNARSQLLDMVNWWFRETTEAGLPARQIRVSYSDMNSLEEAPSVIGAGRIPASDLVGGIEVNGHSLGGYLASAFTRLFGAQAHVQHTSTFNSGGFAPGSEGAFQQLEKVIGLGYGLGRFPGGDEQTNFFAQNGINLTTNEIWFNQVGQRVPVFNEEGTGVPNHYMYKLTDALALGNALFKLDPTLDIARLNSLLNAGSNYTEKSLGACPEFCV